MNGTFYILFLILSLIIFVIGATIKNNSIGVIALSITTYLFSVLAQLAFKLEEIAIINGTATYVSVFNGEWQNEMLMYTMYLFFFISSVSLLVRVIMTFEDYKFKKNGGRSNERYSG